MYRIEGAIMNQISISEARKCLGELVHEAECGQTVSITRRGKEVARIVPADESPLKPLPNLSHFRASIKMKGRTLSQTVIDMRSEDPY